MRWCVGCLRRGGCWRRWGRWILGYMGWLGNGTTEYTEYTEGFGIVRVESERLRMEL